MRGACRRADEAAAAPDAGETRTRWPPPRAGERGRDFSISVNKEKDTRIEMGNDKTCRGWGPRTRVSRERRRHTDVPSPGGTVAFPFKK